MKQRRGLPAALVWLGGVLFLMGFFSGSARSAEKEHEHALLEHKVVRIGRVNLSPEPFEVNTQNAAMWFNLSSQPVEVVLDKNVVAHMHCKEPVAFKLVKGELRSGKLLPFGSASLCSLDPGRYEYTVMRPITGGSGQVSRTTGTIFVKE